MATYRVGEAGATVFNTEGRAIATLRPGYVVVEGLLKDPGSLADQHHRTQSPGKRQAGYAGKVIRPAEDKS